LKSPVFTTAGADLQVQDRPTSIVHVVRHNRKHGSFPPKGHYQAARVSYSLTGDAMLISSQLFCDDLLLTRRIGTWQAGNLSKEGSLAVLAVLLWVLTTIGLVCLAWHFLGQIGRILLRLETLEEALKSHGILLPTGARPLEPGWVATDFELPLLSGGKMRLSQWQGHRVLLIFVDPQCRSSVQLLTAFADLSADGVGTGLIPLVVSKGPAEDSRSFFQQRPIPFPVLLESAVEVSSLYRVFGTPMGYLVGKSSLIEGSALIGAAEILAMLDDRAAMPVRMLGFTPADPTRASPRKGLPAGSPAPDFTLPELSGAEVSLRQHRGTDVLLVFFDPDCAPCTRLAPKLERLQREARRMQVLVVSRGSLELNREKAAALGLTFPILRQQHWEISLRYAVCGAPVAYWIDAHGVLAAGVAAGEEEVLELALRARAGSKDQFLIPVGG
jgi:peroxiredoxin